MPTVVSWPGVLAPREVAAPCQITDWMPTVCARAGYRSNRDLKWDGLDIWPAITGRSAVAARTLYWTAPGFRARAVREGDWKLIASGNLPQEKFELFDLGRDPNERQDLAAEMPKRVAELKARLADVARADRDAEVRR